MWVGQGTLDKHEFVVGDFKNRDDIHVFNKLTYLQSPRKILISLLR